MESNHGPAGPPVGREGSGVHGLLVAWVFWPLAAAAGAVVVRGIFEPVLVGERPFATALPAVLLVTLIAGWGPGLVCMLISIVALEALFVRRSEWFATDELVGLALATAVAVVIIAVGASYRRLRQRSDEDARRALRAADALRESEERFRRLAELSPDAILVLRHGTVVYANRATLHILGASDITQVLGHSPLEMVHPSSRPLLEERMARLLATGEPNPPVEQQYYRFDGGLITVETVSTLVSWGEDDEGRSAPAVQVIARDVTERLRAQQELRETTEALEQFFEDSPLPIHQLDPEGRILRANRAELAMLGYGAGEYIGRNVREFYCEPEQADEVLECLRSGKTLCARELRLRCKDGSERTVLLDANALWRDGRMVHSRCFMVDITEQREAEVILRSALDRFRLCARATNDSIYDWDLDKQELEWNEGIHALLGNGDPEEIKRIEWWREQIHPEDRDAVLASLEEALREGEQWTHEYRFRRTSGEYASVLDRAFIVRAPDGHAARMVGAMIDLTERKRHEEELAKYTKALEASNAELRDFAGVISHDLKEPLRGIAQYAEALIDDARGELGEDVLDRLATINRNANRMRTLLDALMEYGRVGRTELRRRPTDLNLVVGDVLDSLRSRIESERAQVMLVGRLPEVSCDPVLMHQVFSNLIINALKYNIRKPKRVEIGCVRDREPPGAPDGGSPAGEGECVAPARALDNCVIYIRDNGIGIDPRHHEAVFKMFKRLHPRDRFGGGTGSGLSIVRKIIERHQGRIWLESRPGEGSTFYFALPEHQEAGPPIVEVPARVNQASPSRP